MCGSHAASGNSLDPLEKPRSSSKAQLVEIISVLYLVHNIKDILLLTTTIFSYKLVLQ